MHTGLRARTCIWKSAYVHVCYSVGRTQHTSAYLSIRQHTCTCVLVWGLPSIPQHPSAYMHMWYVIHTCCMRINVVLRLPRHFDERLWAWYENVRPYASACMCVHMRLHVCACVRWASVCVCVCVHLHAYTHTNYRLYRLVEDLRYRFPASKLLFSVGKMLCLIGLLGHWFGCVVSAVCWRMLTYVYWRMLTYAGWVPDLP